MGYRVVTILAIAAAAAALALVAGAHESKAATYYVVGLPMHTSIAVGSGAGCCCPACPFPTLVILTNPSSSPVAATGSGPLGFTASLSVPPGSSTSIPLPKFLATPSPITPDATYKIDSSAALEVVSYPTWGYSSVNEAVRHLEANELGTEYYAYSFRAAYPAGYANPYFVVMATQDGTTVTVTPKTTSGNTNPGPGVPAMTSGSTYNYPLNAREVLVVRADKDLSGSHIMADQPVAVFSGNPCDNVGNSACDHMADQMLPVSEAATDYVACSSVPIRVNPGGFDLLRVMAVGAGSTTVTFDPGVTVTLGGPGQFVDKQVTTDEHITSSQPVFVGQYYGLNDGGTDGDPSLVLLPPTSRFNNNYLYEVTADRPSPAPVWKDYTTVAAPVGTSAALDYSALGGWRPVGTSSWRCITQLTTNGTHRLYADQPMGVTVFGKGTATSYWYQLVGDLAAPIRPPTASFTSASLNACQDSVFHFTDTSIGPDIPITAWLWNFGDGSISMLQNPSHLYLAAGTYPVTVTVTDASGVTATTTGSVTTIGDPNCCPVMQPPFAYTVTEGDVLRFSFTTIDLDMTPLAYTVDAASLPGPPSHLDSTTGAFRWWAPPSRAGIYTIHATVTDGQCMDEHDYTITVIRPPPGDPAQDRDLDGIADTSDNCPALANHDQLDTDHDGMGDACQELYAKEDAPPKPRTGPLPPPDADADGIPDASDNCPRDGNRAQDDLDGDHVGDACDADLDGDGVADRGPAGSFLDDCPLVADPLQLDANGDGLGDACNPPVAPDAGLPGGKSLPAVAGSPPPQSTSPLVMLGLGAVGGAMVGVAVILLVRRRPQR